MYFLRNILYYVTYPIRALLYAPERLFSAGKRMLSISLPARVAILSAVFLVIFVIAAFVAFFLTEDRGPWQYWTSPMRIVVITVLVIVIPFVVYKVLKLWLEGEISRYPDIDFAWKAGLAELESHGLDLLETPLFLLLGTAGDVEETALMKASRLSFNLTGVPEGPAALHWYANPDGIYLLLTETCGLSRLARVAKEQAEQEKSGFALPSAGPAARGDVRGTVVPGAEDEQAAPPDSGPVPDEAGSNIRGTMVAQTWVREGGGPAPVEKHPVVLAQEDRNEQERRLQYVCRLLRRARQPLCPVNGIITLLPFKLIQTPREGIEVQRSVQRDLATLRRHLMVRCPVTALVTGMEEEPGFQELVRRVGRDRAAGQRFGRGFSVWNPPIPERLDALAAHACGSFEDWVYTLFREKDSLKKPGNPKLYALLCKIRADVQARLGNILAVGYGVDLDEEPDAEPLLFSGCYFAATGATEDRQAFIRGVFDKLPDEQEELEWTEAALREDDKYQTLAQLGMALDTVLFLGLAGMIVYRWFPFWK